MVNNIKQRSVSRSLIILNCVMALIYMGWWFYFPHADNMILYILLLLGEIYHVGMALGFWFTIYPRMAKKINKGFFNDSLEVDIFITVAGEPVAFVEKTAKAAKDLNYPKKKIYILNDGYIAQKDNWEEIEQLAKRIGVQCITRKTPGGAKAGNINNALRQTKGQLVAILDADMVPHNNFLSELVPYFVNERVAFVQSPQYYKNNEENNITAGAWEQQNFFFGPIMQGKDKLNAAFICGTNVVVRRKALLEVGGVNEQNIAEDFLTSLFIHQRKWQSVYVPEVHCEGLAPEDLLSYYKQQHRWARGSLEILFRFNPFFRKGLTFEQRFQYLLSALYYLNGIIVLIDIIMPVLYLYFGVQPVAATTTSFALFFIPYIYFSFYTIYIASGESITFRAISFSQSSWTLQLSALYSLLRGKKVQFAVTSKQKKVGNFLFLIYPHLLYVIIAITGVIINIFRFGVDPAVTTNSAWVIINIVFFLPFIKAAYQWNNLLHVFSFPWHLHNFSKTNI